MKTLFILCSALIANFSYGSYGEDIGSFVGAGVHRLNQPPDMASEYVTHSVEDPLAGNIECYITRLVKTVKPRRGFYFSRRGTSNVSLNCLKYNRVPKGTASKFIDNKARSLFEDISIKAGDEYFYEGISLHRLVDRRRGIPMVIYKLSSIDGTHHSTSVVPLD